MSPNPVPPRLHVILAREASKAVVIRRGPSKWFRLSLWHTDTDVFEHGQWFKGKIYPKRSDLSPDGNLFIYFAVKYSSYTISQETDYDTSWIAISKPPYFTALALWNIGHLYSEGGLFTKNKTIWLPNSEEAHPDHQPKGLRIDRNTELLTSPYFHRLERDGWIPQYGGDKSALYWRNSWQYHHPLYWHKYGIDSIYYLIMEKAIYHQRSVYTYGLFRINKTDEVLLDDFTWADWDQRGRLVGARGGQIVLMNPAAPNEDVTMLEDFSDHQPDPQPAPSWATRW